MQRLDVGERTKLMMLAPGEEPTDGMQVGGAGVLVADCGGEEFQKASGRLVAGVGDDRRHDDPGRDGTRDPHRLVGRDDSQLLAVIRLAVIHGV